MLQLCSYKPFGLLCSLSYSVLNELRCQMNKPRLNQEVYQIYNSYPEVQRGNDVVNDGLKPSFTANLTPQKNVPYKSFRYRQTTQDDGETIDTF